jgi:hypothetical protein
MFPGLEVGSGHAEGTFARRLGIATEHRGDMLIIADCFSF